MQKLHKPHLIERLRECLPTAADGPDHRVWCNVRGSDLREAVAEIAVQREALTSAVDELERVREEAARLLSLFAEAWAHPASALYYTALALGKPTIPPALPDAPAVGVLQPGEPTR